MMKVFGSMTSSSGLGVSIDGAQTSHFVVSSDAAAILDVRGRQGCAEERPSPSVERFATVLRVPDVARAAAELEDLETSKQCQYVRFR